MGYYTDFNINVERLDGKPIADPDSIIDTLRSQNLYLETADYDVWEGELSISTGDCKWNEYLEDLTNISALDALRDHRLVIYGTGSMPDDLWKMIAINGNSRIVTGDIVYPEIDESTMTVVKPAGENPRTTLFFIQADVDGMNLDQFVEAHDKQEALNLFKSSDLVADFGEHVEVKAVFAVPARTGEARTLPWHNPNGVCAV